MVRGMAKGSRGQPFLRRWMPRLLAITFFSFAPCPSFLVPALVEAAETLVGVAYEPFTLPRHIPLAGYSRRKGKPSRGVHDPVGMRALVLDDGTTTAALVSGDLLIVDETLFDAVRRRLLNEGLPDRLVLVLAATHTHSGPGAYGTRFAEKISMGHFNSSVFDAIVHAAVRATTRAYAARAPARIAYGIAQTSGLLINRVDSQGLVDRELVVSAFYRPTEQHPFAILADFSAHPTTLGAWNDYLSADYPGVVVREVERHMPGATAIFFAGSVGDQGPVKAGDGFERAEWIGVTLAKEVITLLADAHPISVEPLAALQERMTLPPAQVRLGQHTLPRWIGQRLVDDDATLSVVTIGQTIFFGVPCDVSAELGADLKRAAAAQQASAVVIGFASDYIGYCVPAALYAEQQYESSMAFNGPNAGQGIVDRLIQMLSRVKPMRTLE